MKPHPAKPKIMDEVKALRRRFREWSAERGDNGPMPGPWARRRRPANASETRGEGGDSERGGKTRQKAAGASPYGAPERITIRGGERNRAKGISLKAGNGRKSGDEIGRAHV